MNSKSPSFSSSSNLLKSYKNIYWLVGGQHKKGDKFILEKNIIKILKGIFMVKKNFFIKNLKNKIILQSYNNIIKCLAKLKKILIKITIYQSLYFLVHRPHHLTIFKF